MDNKIEAKEIYFKDLFGPKFLFHIPGYQRQYSWEKDNVEQLFDDIREAMDDEQSSYFLGSIILQIIDEKSDGSATYDLVDGQQRLTTLVILLAVMRDLIENKSYKETLQRMIFQKEDDLVNTPEEVRILVRDKDREFFKKYILEENGTLLDINIKDLNESQFRIKNTMEILRSKFYVENKLNKDLLNRFVKYVLNNCIFVYVKTGNFTSAYRLFSVLNDRGMPLTTADLLKSSCLGEINESDRDKYQEQWETIEDELGREEFDQLLGYIRTIFVKEKAKKSIFDEYNEIIFKKLPDFRGKKFFEYVKIVSDIYKEKIQNAEINSSDQEINVKYYNLMSLMRDYITSSDWIPVFISFCIKFNDDDMLYEFLKKLEKKFLINWIRELTPTTRIVEMSKLLNLIESKNNANDIINDDIFKTVDYKNDVYNAINSNLFYSKQFCKYILLRLDMNISENSNIQKSYKGIVTVEHILPQNPKKDSIWLNIFNDIQRQELTSCIGNLVLLSRKKNSAANNSAFDVKLKKYYAKGITDFELTKEITKYNNWDVNSIKERQNDMTQRIINLWVK